MYIKQILGVKHRTKEQISMIYKKSIKKTFTIQFDLNNYIEIQKCKNI